MGRGRTDATASPLALTIALLYRVVVVLVFQNDPWVMTRRGCIDTDSQTI